jgi:uncharacterized protein YhaN
MGDQDQNSGDQGNSGTESGQTGADTRSYTQAELNKLFGERAKQAKSAALAEALKDLGFADLTEAKTSLGELRKLKESQMSEAEKLSTRLKELEGQQANWNKERQEMLVRSEVMAAAGKLGLVDPDAAYRLLDLAALEYDENGKPKNLDKALAELIKAKPYLSGSAYRASGNAGNGSGGSLKPHQSMNDFIRQSAGRKT